MAKMKSKLNNRLKNRKLSKLKKTRRSEMRWGQRYFSALEETVFLAEKNEHEIPIIQPSLKRNSSSQQIYICEQCGDSFHFQSSLKDHISRFSWIVGYRCHDCLSVHHSLDKSLHNSCENEDERLSCFPNMKEADKEQKNGSILLFYNQCQFLQHLKIHKVDSVDINKIMLMPLPYNIQPEEYSQLKKVTKVLMEHMFIQRIHIMDWLRLKKIDFKWWKTNEFQNNLVANLLNKYSVDCMNNKNFNLQQVIDLKKHEKISLKNNSYTLNAVHDICNPEYGGSESSYLDRVDSCCSNHHTELINFESIHHTNAISSSNIPEFSNFIPTFNKLLKMNFNSAGSDIEKKMYNFQSSQCITNITMSALTNQLQSNIKNQQIIMTNQQHEEYITFEKVINIENVNLGVKVNANEVKKKYRLFNPNILFKSVVRNNFKPQSKIIIIDLNDTKRLLIISKFNVVKNLMHIIPIFNTISKFNLMDIFSTGTNSILTKTILLIEQCCINRHESNDSGNKVRTVNEKYREIRHQNLHITDKNKIHTIIRNIKLVDGICSNTIDFNINKIWKIFTITIQNSEKYFHFSNYGNIEIGNRKEMNKILNLLDYDWESNIIAQSSLVKCGECRKTKKPKNYIIGVFKSAKNESDYCQCYNNICHLCNSKQGSILRFEAHLKFHKKETPYTCPECFSSFLCFNQLEIHIWTCHHITTQLFSCKICETERFLTPEEITRYYFENHAKIVTYCKKCRMTFSSPNEFEFHNSEKHNSTMSFTNVQKYIKCGLSECIMEPEAFHSHIFSLGTVEKYICYTCSFCSFVIKSIKTLIQKHVLYLNSSQMNDVILSSTLIKVGLSLPVLYRLKPITLASKENAIIHKIMNTSFITPKISKFGSCDNYDIQNYQKSYKKNYLGINNKILIQNHFNLEYKDQEKLEGARIIESLITDIDPRNIYGFNERINKYLQYVEQKLKNPKNSLDREIQVKLSFIENLEIPQQSTSIHCERKYPNKLKILEQSNNSNKKVMKTLLSIKRKKKSGKRWRLALNGPKNCEEIPINYKCHLCGVLVSTRWQVIKNHFTNNHSENYELVIITPKLSRMSSENIKMDLTKNEKKRKSDFITSAAKKKARWAFKKCPDKSTSSNLGICVQQESFQEDTGSNLKCKKCHQIFNTVNMLREHIALNHRIQGHFLICLECGENFVVSPSLQMHLKAFHGIDDPVTYMSQNTLYASNGTDEIETQDRITKSNQCYVCMAVFENKTAVDKHLRVHGMAFLNRRRIETQNALKHCKKITLISNPNLNSFDIQEQVKKNN